MSAIHEITRDRAVRKYHTKIKAIVHSHGKDSAIDISSDVAAANFGKTLKGTGQANLTLVPSRNFLNNFGPNDYINIYFSRADGFGWTRVFFGMIDRIEESYALDQSGKPTTTYSLMCSDFAKVFDRSQYYINNAIMNRDDVFAQDIGNAVASVALYSKGMLIQGTPADIVMQIIVTLLGFSGQFTIPESYGKSVGASALVTENNMLRTQLAETYLPASTVARLPVGGLYKVANDAFNESRLKGLRDQITNGTLPTDQITALASQYGVDPENLGNALSGSDAIFRDVASSQLIKNTLMSLSGVDDSYAGLGQVANRLVTSALPGVPRNMLNLINIGTFVERRGIAGFTHGVSITDANTAIISLIRSHANEFVNEMFFDLRPLSSENGGFSVGATWSTESDEIGGNEASLGVPNGVRYVPAMIMREYPFSTIQGIDASQSPLHLKLDNGEILKYKKFDFGAIFSDQPNVPGRHIVEIPNINIRDKNTNPSVYRSTTCQKHLDVAVIHSSEIIKSSFGRSDTDVVNLIELTTDANQGTASNRYMINLLPIITPISIMHHGLRVKRDSTRYARANAPYVAQENAPGAAGGPTASSGGSAPPQNIVPPGGMYPPVRVKANQKTRSFIIHPDRKSNLNWGFVRTKNNGTEIRIHNGIDIYGASSTRRGGPGVPVFAAMDGTVVGIWKNGNGAQNVYGNCVCIKHPGYGANGTTVYTFYAHMGVPKYINASGQLGSDADISQGKNNPDYNAEIDYLSDGIVAGLQIDQHVNAGQHIGWVGYSAGTIHADESWRRYGPLHGYARGRGMGHLHFEIRTANVNVSAAFPIADKPVLPPQIPLEQTSEYHRSKIKTLDPIQFYADRGMDIYTVTKAENEVPGVTESSTPPPVVVPTPSGDPNANMTPGTDQNVSIDPNIPIAPGTGAVLPEDGQGEDDDNPPDQPISREDASDTPQQPVEQPTVSPSNTDDALDGETVQNLLARWALLQDHWYQHNHEYVAGSIELRGAPEIRVGYRLDIIDRNMSFYVESVNHTWSYAGAMTTTLKVTRGQPNNPYPAYIHTRTKGLGKDVTQRYNSSRLSKYFLVPDPITLKRAKVFRRNDNTYLPIQSTVINEIDTDEVLSRRGNLETYIVSGSRDMENETDRNAGSQDDIPDSPQEVAERPTATVDSPVEHSEATVVGVTPPDTTQSNAQ